MLEKKVKKKLKEENFLLAAKGRKCHKVNRKAKMEFCNSFSEEISTPHPNYL